MTVQPIGSVINVKTPISEAVPASLGKAPDTLVAEVMSDWEHNCEENEFSTRFNVDS